MRERVAKRSEQQKENQIKFIYFKYLNAIQICSRQRILLHFQGVSSILSEVHLTAQTPDILVHRGQQWPLCERLLDPYLNRIRKSRRPTFVETSSANWKGYTATWEIREGVLHLVALEGFLKIADTIRNATLATALPWVKGSLPATWVNDMVRCPEGRIITYVHHAYASRYERDRFFCFDRGHLADEFLVLNPPEPIVYRFKSDGSRVCVEGWGSEEIPDPLDGDDLSNAHKVWGLPPAQDEDEGYVIGGEYRFPPE